MSWILTAVIGVLGGVMSGLFGVGGGAVFVPLFVFSGLPAFKLFFSKQKSVGILGPVPGWFDARV